VAVELIRINFSGTIRRYWFAAGNECVASMPGCEELSMITSNLSRVPAELQQKKDPIAEGGAQGPMSQQDAADCHGHDMHPQKFVQLVGCHETSATQRNAA
jgi:hypothetical protein